MKKTLYPIRINCRMLLLGAVLCMSAAACSQELEKTDILIVRQDGSSVTVRAELAVTEAEQARGFMERKSIPEGTGMLFVFPSDWQAHFWMKDTPVPLSIAYIDSSGRIRDIFDMQPLSLAGVSSTVSVRYALEVPQGWFARNGISEGDRIRLPVQGL